MSFTVEREIAEGMDWYQVHHVVEGYKKMLKLLKHDIGMDETIEVHYEQNVDSGYFRAHIISLKQFGRKNKLRDVGADATLAFDIVMYTRSSPTMTEDGWFGVVEFNPIAKLLVEMPGSKHKRSHNLFRRVWYDLVFREQFERLAENAEEELLRYMNEVRNFYGLEPTVRKTRRLEYEPLVYGYI